MQRVVCVADGELTNAGFLLTDEAIKPANLKNSENLHWKPE